MNKCLPGVMLSGANSGSGPMVRGRMHPCRQGGTALLETIFAMGLLALAMQTAAVWMRLQTTVTAAIDMRVIALRAVEAYATLWQVSSASMPMPALETMAAWTQGLPSPKWRIAPLQGNDASAMVRRNAGPDGVRSGAQAGVREDAHPGWSDDPYASRVVELCWQKTVADSLAGTACVSLTVGRGNSEQTGTVDTGRGK